MPASLELPSPTRPDARPRTSRLIGRVVAASLTTGLLAAILLVAFVVPGAAEHVITGSVMLALGLGWALLAVLSQRPTNPKVGHLFRPPT